MVMLGGLNNWGPSLVCFSVSINFPQHLLSFCCHQVDWRISFSNVAIDRERNTHEFRQKWQRKSWVFSPVENCVDSCRLEVTESPVCGVCHASRSAMRWKAANVRVYFHQRIWSVRQHCQTQKISVRIDERTLKAKQMNCDAREQTGMSVNWTFTSLPTKLPRTDWNRKTWHFYSSVEVGRLACHGRN